MGCCQSRNYSGNRNPIRKTENKTQDKIEIFDHKQQEQLLPENNEKLIYQVKKKKLKKKYPRQYMEPKLRLSENVLTHHLKHELTLSKLTSMKKISRRFILQHLQLQTHFGKNGGVNQLRIDCRNFQQSLFSAWIQRTFVDILKKTGGDFLLKDEEYQSIRKKIAEEFMFELYQIKQFIDSGMGRLSFMLQQTNTQLSSFVELSDDALYNIFKQLKYKQTVSEVANNNEAHQIKNRTTNINIFDHFEAKSFSDPDNMNYQTIFEDLNFLFSKAIQEQETFKKDMKALMGQDVVTDVKVKKYISQNGKVSYKASTVKNILVKWVEYILNVCPYVKTTKIFMNFIKNKGVLIDSFFFKSTIQSSSHQTIITYLCMILQAAKFKLNTKIKNPQFIFNIYDLLRCKVKKKSQSEIISLFKNIQRISKTQSGKLFGVTKVINRLKKRSTDIIINFRYGDVLIAEAQLQVKKNDQEVPRSAKIKNQINFLVSKLDRSIFGPTIQLMIEYEDKHRPELTVNLQAEGQVINRDSQIIVTCKMANRICPQGHQMVSLAGNYIVKPTNHMQTSQQLLKTEIITLCQYCGRNSTLKQQFDYCYQCGCYLCKECVSQYQKVLPQQFIVTIQRSDLLPQVKTIYEIQKICHKFHSLIVLFWLDGSSPSIMLKDCMIFHQAKLKMQHNKFTPNIAHAKYSANSQFRKIIQKYNIQAYPSLVLFNRQAQPFKTVIGCNWFQVPNLYAIQHLFAEKKDISSLNLHCIFCNEIMEAEDQIRDQNTCINCFNMSKNTYVPTEVASCGVYCPNNHYRCMNCCYMVLDCPSTYKDFLGEYLSSCFVAPYLGNCPKGHQVILNKEAPIQRWNFTCWDCGQESLFDDEHGVGQCKQCKAFLCARCIGAQQMNLKEMQENISLVMHCVESTAENIQFCSCKRPFKQVYSTRYSSLQQLQEASQKKWKCYLCETYFKHGQLHLACFGCPSLSAEGDNQNFEICMRCANRSNMIKNTPLQKVVEQKSLISCPYDYSQLIVTSNIKNGNLTFDCFYCQQKYFGHSLKFYCKQCQMHCCYHCRKKLWQKAPLMCRQKCPNGHSLRYKTLTNKRLSFCDGSFHSIREDEAFICQKDNYHLCISCSQSLPSNYIGDALAIAKSEQINDNKIEQISENFLYGTFDGYDQDDSGQSWRDGFSD